MRPDVTQVLDEGTTLLALQVRNKPALLGLRKLIRSPPSTARPIPDLATALFPVRDPRRAAATCGGGRACIVSWSDDGPAVTVVVRCDPVVRGPDVAPMWPPAVPSLEGASAPHHPA